MFVGDLSNRCYLIWTNEFSFCFNFVFCFCFCFCFMKWRFELTKVQKAGQNEPSVSGSPSNVIYANLCDQENGFVSLQGDCVSFCPESFYFLMSLNRCQRCGEVSCSSEIPPAETMITRKPLSEDNKKKGFDFVLASRSADTIYEVDLASSKPCKSH